MHQDREWFIGRKVYKHFDEDDSVWEGRVIAAHRNKRLPENFWVVKFPPEPKFPEGYEEHWDHGDMLKFGIDFTTRATGTDRRKFSSGSWLSWDPGN